MFLRNYICFFLCLISLAINQALFGDESELKPEIPTSSIISQRYLEKINVLELKLSNGMTICLKKTDTDSGEIFFKLSALGGSGSLNRNQFFSGRLADRIALESGIGNMSSDEFSVFLYENDLEFILEITPFCRTIEAEGREKSIEAFFNCIKMIFCEQHLTEKGCEEAINLTKNTISKLSNDSDKAYEEVFQLVNTQSFRLLRPLKIDDLAKVDFKNAKAFFQQSFSDPSDFFCVVTGNFDLEKVKKMIEIYIAPISKPSNSPKFAQSHSISFPPGITETTISLPNQVNCLTHITFPLQISVDEQNITKIAFMCQIIEGRLRNEITNKMSLSYGVDVTYEFPIYPFLSNPWISIRYRCEENRISGLKAIVLSELKRLQEKGATTEELATIKKLEKSSQEFWLNDDFYWVSMLTNYYLWAWNPEKIDQENTTIYHLCLDELNALLNKAISLDNYSVITAKGQKN